MFTIKLYRPETTDYEGGKLAKVISAKEYEVYDRGNGEITIIVNGCDYHISEKTSNSYMQCYIENMAGKTIDSYSVYATIGKAA